MGVNKRLTFFADKINLKGAGFILTHVLLPVRLAEDI